MADSPLVIKIPPGATEIDLRPILEPLFLHVIGVIRTGPYESRHPTPDDIPGFIKDVNDEYNYQILRPFLKRQVLKDYLEANGWEREYKQYDSVYIRYGDRVNLMADDRVFDGSLSYVDEAVRQVQRATVGWSKKPRVFVIKKILASRSILDQIVDDEEDE